MASGHVRVGTWWPEAKLIAPLGDSTAMRSLSRSRRSPRRWLASYSDEHDPCVRNCFAASSHGRPYETLREVPHTLAELDLAAALSRIGSASRSFAGRRVVPYSAPRTPPETASSPSQRSSALTSRAPLQQLGSSAVRPCKASPDERSTTSAASDRLSLALLITRASSSSPFDSPLRSLMSPARPSS